MAPDDTDEDGNRESKENVSSRFDRLPATADERVVEGRATREEILDWWHERFGVEPSTLEDYSFWERGSGKIWAFQGALETPVDIEALGMVAVRTRQEHWKPTLEAVQRFGTHATRNCIELSEHEAATFMAGEDQELDWDGDWGYLIVTHELAGEPEPLGVGLYTYGELKSMVPKGRRREL
jgi:NOL1/NOP2/fmu family ribosome biogenesis protein